MSPESDLAAAGWELLRAGGWVSAILVAAVTFLVWALTVQRRRVRELQHELRGTRVRSGYLAESLAPLAEGFPVDVTRDGTTTVFLGQPVDFIHFDPDEGLVLIEVKSGRAQLSDRQRRLRDLVESGRVRWETFRVS